MQKPTCPGDSGGPVLNSSGQIVGVVSGTQDAWNATSGALVSSTDILADVGRNHEWLQNAAVFFGGSDVLGYCDLSAAQMGGNCLNFRTPAGVVNSAHPEKYAVCAEGGGGGDVNANRTNAAEWELFRMIYLGGPTNHPYYAIQTWNGRFWSAQGNGGGALVADRTEIGPWETFRLRYAGAYPNTQLTSFGTLPGGPLAIETTAGYFVSANDNGNSFVDVHASAIGAWEVFDVVAQFR